MCPCVFMSLCRALCYSASAPPLPSFFLTRRDLPNAELSKTVVFGFGCDLTQHMKYGMCRDGQCGRRAAWEKVTLFENDLDRLRGDREMAICGDLSFLIDK